MIAKLNRYGMWEFYDAPGEIALVIDGTEEIEYYQAYGGEWYSQRKVKQIFSAIAPHLGKTVKQLLTENKPKCTAPNPRYPSGANMQLYSKPHIDNLIPF